MSELKLDSRKATDDDGLRLRSTHFPYHMEKLVPPRSAGFSTRTRTVDKKLTMTNKLSANMTQNSVPTIYMMVDYQQDRKQISAKLLIDSIKAQQRTLNLPSSLTNRNRRTKDSPSKARSPGRPPQPLRSSFILQSRPPGDQDLNPIVMFNKEDKALQYEPTIRRLDMNIAAYQTWSSKTVEPFFKVSIFSQRQFMR